MRVGGGASHGDGKRRLRPQIEMRPYRVSLSVPIYPTHRNMEVGMSQRGTDFANHWVFENINAGPYAPEDGPHPEAEAAVEKLVADAAGEGISQAELEEDLGDLHDFVSNAFEE